jgi:hypothetical protein
MSAFVGITLGFSIGFYLTFNLQDKQHNSLRNNLYYPIKLEMRKDEDNYWTRIFTTTSTGISKTWDDATGK